jgi:hypothetical protein
MIEVKDKVICYEVSKNYSLSMGEARGEKMEA